MDSLKGYNWVKNFGVKISLFTANCCGVGNYTYPSKRFDLPVVPNYVYFDAEEVRTEEFMKELEEAVSKDPLIIGKKVLVEVKNISDKLVDFARKTFKEHQSYTKEEMLQKYSEFVEVAEHFFGTCDYPIFIETVYVEKIKDAFGEMANDLLVCAGESDPVKQKRIILEMALEYKNGKDVKGMIDKFLRDYDWASMALFFGTPKTADDVYKKIKEIKNPEKELKELKEKNDAIKKKFKDAYDNIESEELKKYVDMVQELMHIRDYRYLMLCLGYRIIIPFMEQFAKSIGLSFMELIHLLPEEVQKVYDGEVEKYKELAQQRLERYGYIFIEGKATIVSGDEVGKLRTEVFGSFEGVNEVRGTAANKGKATGTVRIMREPSDLPKFNKGDILVSAMTTPYLMPAVEKSAAIVTDIGGVTCHAAIISRELDIPCIIATENATMIFKDGDLVEVDANKGVVKRIK